MTTMTLRQRLDQIAKNVELEETAVCHGAGERERDRADRRVNELLKTTAAMMDDKSNEQGEWRVEQVEFHRVYAAALAVAQQRAALAEEHLSELKAMLEDMRAQREDMRAQRDAWQSMVQARLIPPAPVSTMSWWRRWLRSAGK